MTGSRQFWYRFTPSLLSKCCQSWAKRRRCAHSSPSKLALWREYSFADLDKVNSESSNESAPKENVVFDQVQEPEKETKPPKIRGAPILVAVGLFISLVQNRGYFFGSIAPIIGDPTWARVTKPGSP